MAEPTEADALDPRTAVGPWQARVLNSDGRLRGSGVLISDRYVLTCAHVLAAGQDRPTGTFRVGFPRSEQGLEVAARVAEDGWFPGVSMHDRDVAILELEKPVTGLRHAQLGQGKNRGRGAEAEVFGHTTSLVNGVWSRVEISHTVGPSNQRVQLSPARNLTPETIVKGFSGAGVIDIRTGLVLGIVATAMTDADRTVAFMIPMETVGIYWPGILAGLDEAAGDGVVPGAVSGYVRNRATTLLSMRAAMDKPVHRRWVAERLPLEARSRITTPSPSVRELVHACWQASELRILADLVFHLDEAPAGFGPIEDLLSEIGAERPEPSSQPEVIGPLTRRELWRSILLESQFHDRGRRGLYFSQLRRRMRTERDFDLELEVTDHAEDDARALVEACCARSGALRTMLLDFPFTDVFSIEFSPLRIEVEQVAPRLLLTDEERDDLAQLLSDVPAIRLSAAHQWAVPTLAAQGRPGGEVAGLIRRIEGYHQRGAEVPRIFVFVERLALGLDQDRADDLRRWQDRTAARQRLGRTSMDEMRHHEAEEAPPSEPAVLRIEFAPDKRSADLFLLSVVLENGPSPRVPKSIVRLHRSDGLAECLDHLDRALEDRFEMLHPYLDELVIEVVLPRRLITEPVDRWKIPVLSEVPLGSRFPVLLRSYERMNSRHLRRQCRQKGRAISLQSAPSFEVMHYVAPADRSNPRDLWQQLRPDTKLVLACGRPPADQANLDPADEYAAALEAGVPFIVWVRDAGLAGAFREWIEEVLATDLVRDLPDRIADHRSAAWLDEIRPDGLRTQMSIVACHLETDPLENPRLYAPERMPS